MGIFKGSLGSLGSGPYCFDNIFGTSFPCGGNIDYNSVAYMDSGYIDTIRKKEGVDHGIRKYRGLS